MTTTLEQINDLYEIGFNNVQEYTPFGSANNYSPSYSFFNNMNRK